MRLNAALKVKTETTHEGGKAVRVNSVEALRRSVMSCLLWESEFYEDGEEIAARIGKLCGSVAPSVVADIAIEAREKMHLRHVPLLLASYLCRTGSGSKLPGDTIARVIQRADELAEFIAVYAKVNGVTPDKVKSKLSAQAKRGLAEAFKKFDEYQLAKYNRDGAVKLRDALFLSHAKPKDVSASAINFTKAERKKIKQYDLTPGEKLYARLVDGELKTPDTWEVELSGGADKRETFERLIREGNLGYLALLRNLRNMIEAKCDADLVETAIRARKNGAHRVLPFRYIAAARCAPAFAEPLNDALLACVEDLEKFSGLTAVMVDVSGSMNEKLSAKSDLKRMDAAAALASIWPGRKRVFTFSDGLMECTGWKGLPGINEIINSQSHGGTRLAAATAALNQNVEYDRLVIITDEQSQDGSCKPLARARGYMLNVASAKNGVGYPQTGYVHIDGWSENVIRYIHEFEKLA